MLWFWFHPSLDVDQESAGAQVYPTSMSQTTEPSTDGPAVSEGLKFTAQKNKNKGDT